LQGCINALTAGKGNRGRSEFFPGKDKGQDLERDLLGIGRLIKDSGKNTAVIVYYGGEPMLRLEPMARLYRALPGIVGESTCLKHMVITSGHYLENAIRSCPDLVSRMWLTALSIDGNEEQHDAMRRGTSLKKIRRQVEALNQVRQGRCSSGRPCGLRCRSGTASTPICNFRKRGERSTFSGTAMKGMG